MKRTIIFFTLLSVILLISTGKADANAFSLKAGTVNTNGSKLNVRSEANSSSSKQALLSDGSYLTIHGQSGNWYYVEYQSNKFGYVYEDYVDVISTKFALTNTSGALLNVRSYASTQATILAKLADQTSLVILSSTTYWSKVLYQGNAIGYVYNNYLKSSNTITNSITLNVPSYKQFDTRWKYKLVGNTNSNIGQIGCAITSLAMIESYRNGTAITPSLMENRLTYTSGGALYWPSYYTLSNTSNYLTTIRNNLKNQVPTIIGAKNSKSSHYVVIIGVKSTNSTNLADFYINDPGSSYRSNLSDFIRDYPIYLKIVY